MILRGRVSAVPIEWYCVLGVMHLQETPPPDSRGDLDAYVGRSEMGLEASRSAQRDMCLPA